MKAKTAAWHLGYEDFGSLMVENCGEAYWSGPPDDSCPFPAGSPDAADWLLGFECATEDAFEEARHGGRDLGDD